MKFIQTIQIYRHSESLFLRKKDPNTHFRFYFIIAVIETQY